MTAAVAKGRQEASIPGLTKSLAEMGFTLQTGQTPVFPDSTDQCTFIDYRATAQASGRKIVGVQNAVLEIQKDDPGHTNNIRMARRAAASVSLKCLGEI